VEICGLEALCQAPNKQLQRTVIRRHVRAASAPFHYALTARFTRQCAAPDVNAGRELHIRGGSKLHTLGFGGDFTALASSGRGPIGVAGEALPEIGVLAHAVAIAADVDEMAVV
jgi:hypothetical protein